MGTSSTRLFGTYCISFGAVGPVEKGDSNFSVIAFDSSYFGLPNWFL